MRESALLLCFLSIAPAQAQTSLAWSFPPGGAFDMERVATQDQVVELRGKTFKQTSTVTWQVHFDVRAKAGESVTLEASLEKVQMRINGAADNKLAEKLQGRKFTLLVTPQGRIVEMHGYTAFLREVADGDKDRVKALRLSLPEDGLKAAFVDMLGDLPERPAKTWERALREPLPHFGTLVQRWHVKDAGTSDVGRRLTYVVTTKYEPPSGDAGLFKVVKGDVQGENGSGTIVFDPTQGRLLSHDRTMRVHGNLTIADMGEVPLEFTSDNTLRVRLLPAKAGR